MVYSFYFAHKQWIFSGGGTMTIGFRSPYQNISAVLGKLSGFNLWSYPIKAEEILRMSQGCGNEAGDVKACETVRKGLTKEVEVKRHRSCRHRKGKFYLTSLIPPDRQQDSVRSGKRKFALTAVFKRVVSKLWIVSPQTSFGVRLSRIHRYKRTPKDVCGEAKLWTKNVELGDTLDVCLRWR